MVLFIIYIICVYHRHISYTLPARIKANEKLEYIVQMSNRCKIKKGLLEVKSRWGYIPSIYKEPKDIQPKRLNCSFERLKNGPRM